ncbi:large conductance mechanosensitive channel protein MscL [Agromyces sp. H3Y2-19a]|uniref:large conductance mechanosensitive channel protein MscL n=1 Tax=Agromyces chromiiresistens TaxID=3030835 RepID=UPI0023B90492|nr:large conductance mechanosensitive channel protein MscL [Agromyces chromiiresistens]MDF0512823.1 large conductance mechanosensitive channel protein MscL [Agromyces chromiiresistens]
MIKGFKEFIMRGNVIDLAVAVVIGAAFTAVVNSIVANLIDPLISLLFKADSLDQALVWTVGDTKFSFGSVIGAIISFLAVAAVVYFVFVMPMNHFKERAEQKRKAGQPDPEEPETELTVLAQIRDLLAEQGSVVGSGRHSDQ